MGFNSVIFQLNDTLDRIRQNPDRFAELMVRALGSGSAGRDRSPDLYHEFGTTVVAVEHASSSIIIASGGNHASVLGVSSAGHHNEEGRIKLLRDLADSYGYTLTPKKGKK